MTNADKYFDKIFVHMYQLFIKQLWTYFKFIYLPYLDNIKFNNLLFNLITYFVKLNPIYIANQILYVKI